MVRPTADTVKSQQLKNSAMEKQVRMQTLLEIGRNLLGICPLGISPYSAKAPLALCSVCTPDLAFQETNEP